ncbi:MAG: S8 family serine peptidase, partial [Pseudobdellovibrionaceae bacterium]
MKIFLNFNVLLLGLYLGSIAQAGQILHFQRTNVDPTQSVNRSRPFGRISSDFVLQFQTHITEQDKRDLIASGIQYFRYIPDDALIVRATEGQLRQFAVSHKIHGYLPYHGDLKISTELPVLSVFSMGKTVDATIHTLSQEDRSRVKQVLVQEFGQLVILDESDLSLTVQVQQTWLRPISEMNGIEFIEPKAEFQMMYLPLDTDPDITPAPLVGDYKDLSGYETGTKIMKLSAVWDLGFTGLGQKIGIADTGLDTGNLSTLAPDFSGAVAKGVGFGVGANGSWSDPMGHGTHVAGSVLGRGTASARQLRGAAYDAQVIAQGMWSPMISNLTVPQKLSQLFQSAYDEQARIHTNSWGAANDSLAGSYEGTAQQADQFMWDHPDMLILFAAGNSGVDKNKDGRIDAGSVSPPGTAKNVLTVGASENLLSVGGIQVPIKELRGAATNWGAEPILSSKVSDNPDGI